jgi:hypothetical protein
MSKLHYFKGKVCTVLTSPANRHFDDTQHANVFVGLVEEIDELGVWLIQLAEKKKSFFTHRSLVGIIEETVTVFNEDEAKEVRKQLEARIPPKDGQQLISVDSLKKLKNNNQLEKKK